MSFLFSVGPRAIIAPIPSSIAPARCGLPPGTSVAGVTSTTIAMSGVEPERGRARTVRPDLLLHGRDRDRVDLRVASRRSRRAASSAMYAPSRLSSAFESSRPFGSSTGSPAPHAGVADAHELLGLLAARCTDVEVEVGVLEPPAVAHLLRVDALARRPRPGMRPFAVSSSKRCPCSVSGPIPPIVDEREQAVRRRCS